MHTQPDAAEEVLRKSDGPMHYKAIVEEAVRQGLIICTEQNAKWLHTNVRKAIDSDARFIKLDRGTFDLAARQPHSSNQEKTISMTNSVSTEDVVRNVEAMLSALNKTSGVLEVSMEKVRDVFGYRRNSTRIAQEIEDALQQHGLGHFPTSLDVKQHVSVLIYRIDSVAGRLVKAAGQETGYQDKYVRAMKKVCEIVHSLE